MCLDEDFKRTEWGNCSRGCLKNCILFHREKKEKEKQKLSDNFYTRVCMCVCVWPLGENYLTRPQCFFFFFSCVAWHALLPDFAKIREFSSNSELSSSSITSATSLRVYMNLKRFCVHICMFGRKRERETSGLFGSRFFFFFPPVCFGFAHVHESIKNKKSFGTAKRNFFLFF